LVAADGRHRRDVVLTGVTLALILNPAAPTTFSLTGSMTVTCGTYGCGGYSDIHAGAQVEVVDRDNRVLAVGELRQSGVSGSYAFMVVDVPKGKGMYGVHIGNNNRGVIWKSEAEASTSGFALSLG
jgi:hypothetical protein